MTRAQTTVLMTATAIALAVLGVALLFAPEEQARAIGAPAAASPWLQVLGGACLGLGALDWLSRRSLIGGIYGRPVAAANQIHFTIGALTLVRHGWGSTPPAAYWILTSAYVLGALLFNGLTFGPPPQVDAASSGSARPPA
jgi:hypothetical protein